MGQQAHLAAMMSIMHNHVSKHGSARRPRPGPAVAMELSDPAAWAGEAFAEHFRAAFCAFPQGSARLSLRAFGTVEPDGQFDVGRGKPQPLAPYVVHMRKDGGDSAPIPACRLRSPSFRIKMSEDELVHPFADSETLEERFAKLRGGASTGNADHRTSLKVLPRK